MSSGKKIARIAILSFVSLFLVGAVEFLLKADPVSLEVSDNILEVTLIVGAVHGILGIVGALVLLAGLSLLRRLGIKAPLEFALFLLWALVAFSFTGYEANTNWLQGIPWTHPLSLVVTLLLLILSLAVFYLVYRFLRQTALRSLFGITGLSILLLFPTLAVPDMRAEEIAPPDPPAAGKQTDVNFLLITIDTLRPDHLGCYGHEGIRTPAIDKVARSGARFENALTSIPITLPSHASIMTGLYPPTHGIRYNGAFSLHDSTLTLAEVLRMEGYTTGAVVGSYALDSEFGLDQGFHYYNDAYPSGNILKFKYPELWPSLTRLLLSQVLLRLLPLDLFASEPQRRADKVTLAALDWLEDHGGEKFFLWVHYFDPHTPYDPPPVRELGQPKTSIPDRTLVTHPPPYRYWWGELDRLEEVYLRYDAEIEYTDHWLGRLLDKVEVQPTGGKTLIVITADHGECLWEHDLPGHGYSIFDSELRVPLIVSLPGTVPAGSRIDTPVELIDLFPSVLEILDIEMPGSVQGRSLLTLFGGDSGDEREPAYSETLWPSDPVDRVKGIRTRDWKYIASLGGGSGLLFHLPTDPNERKNLIEEKPDVVRTFDARLVEMSGRLGDEGGMLPEMDEDVKARLRALGYIR